jgi:hypothetical protein
MIEDLMKSAKETLLERLSSPLLGSFVVSWCLWNYKFLVILFSSASVTTTFLLIEQSAFPDGNAVLVRGVVLPLVTTLAYIFIYPYPAKRVYGFTRRRQLEINNLKRQIENETPLTLEQSRAIRADAFALEQKHKQEIDALTTEISRLKDVLKARELSPNRDEPILPSPSPSRPVTETQFEILKSLDNSGGAAFESVLLANSSVPKVQKQFDLGELANNHLIRKEYDGRKNQYRYEFTHEGRRVYLQQSGLNAAENDSPRNYHDVGLIKNLGD